MHFIKHYPTPIAGLTLGLSGIAAFWSGMLATPLLSHAILLIIGAVALALLTPLLLKFVFNPTLLLTDLKHPTVGSVVPTIAMTLMLLSHTASLFSTTIPSIIWLLAIGLHALFFSIFCYHRLREIDLDHLVPSWFVPPIGIVVACLTVPSPQFLPLAYLILSFGIIAYMILLPMVIYRLSLGVNIDNARKPTLAILAAPASLTLAGYLSLASTPNPLIVVSLWAIAVLMTVSVYIMLAHLLRLPFTPAYSAFTFPLAISATAMYKVSVWTEQVPLLHAHSHILFGAALIEGGIATAMIYYVLQHYLKFLVATYITHDR